MKASTLAIAGGAPARKVEAWKRIISVGASFIDEREVEAARRVLMSRQFYKHWGKEVKQLEAAFQQRFDLGNALAVSSGTSALDGILAALDVGPGDEIIVPAFGFIGVAAPVLGCGATPRFCNVDETLTVDVSELESLIRPSTRAVVAVHMKGEPASVVELARLCRDRGVILIEDVAQALGASFEGRPLGSFGDASYFSLQQFKMLTVGEGGVLGVRSAEHFRAAQLACDVASFWAMGLESTPVPLRRSLANYRMSELQAAVGLVQLEKLDTIRGALREAQGGLLARARLPGGWHLRPRHTSREDTTFQSIVIQLEPTLPAVEIEAALRAEGVEASLLYRESGQVDRHFCKHWARALGRESISPGFDPTPTESILSRSLEVQVDPLWTSQDIEEIATGLNKVSGHFGAA
jgi:8-amino-3,8-dideoxy-alpha-D-manno-octulosonate transaminase